MALGSAKRGLVEKKKSGIHIRRCVFMFTLLISSLEFVLYTFGSLVYLD